MSIKEIMIIIIAGVLLVGYINSPLSEDTAEAQLMNESTQNIENVQPVASSEVTENNFDSVSSTEQNEYITYCETDTTYEVGADGHKITLVNNASAKNVTYNELMAFLKNDKTDLIPYDDNKFVCSDYAETVHNNAEQSGISAAWVGIEWMDGSVGHAINGFNTTDKGMVYIDCTAGSGNADSWDTEISTLNVGSVYTPSMLFDDGYTCDPMGIVASTQIYW